MGRSVSYPSGSEVVIYSHFDYSDDEYVDQYRFDDCVNELSHLLIKQFPSLYESEEYIGREDRAFVENDLVYIGLSEYCGIISVWVKPKDQYYDFGCRFARQIENKLKQIINDVFGIRLTKTGTFSNGESIYNRV